MAPELGAMSVSITSSGQSGLPWPFRVAGPQAIDYHPAQILGQRSSARIVRTRNIWRRRKPLGQHQDFLVQACVGDGTFEDVAHDAGHARLEPLFEARFGLEVSFSNALGEGSQIVLRLHDFPFQMD
jgi:hypothetical protein